MGMTRCLACRHDKVLEIDQALIEGEKHVRVARHFGLTKDTIYRHATNHLGLAPSATIVSDRRLAEEQTALQSLHALADDLEARAREPMGDAAFVANANERRRVYAAMFKIEGPSTPARRSLADEPEWIALRQRLLSALEPFPDAHGAFLEAETAILASLNGPAGV
jgi:hypothetical protein